MPLSRVDTIVQANAHSCGEPWIFPLQNCNPFFPQLHQHLFGSSPILKTNPPTPTPQATINDFKVCACPEAVRKLYILLCIFSSHWLKIQTSHFSSLYTVALCGVIPQHVCVKWGRVRIILDKQPCDCESLHFFEPTLFCHSLTLWTWCTKVWHMQKKCKLACAYNANANWVHPRTRACQRCKIARPFILRILRGA